MNLKTLDNLDLKGKRVLLRCDLNVPFDLEGKVLDSTKIERHKLTIDELIHKQAKIIIISHLGRPKGSYQENLSLKKVLKVFANKIKVSQVTVMPFCKPDILKKVINDVSGGTITFMENIRFHPEEEKNDEKFAKELAECADYFVNDSFSVSHRKHVSTYGLSKFLPTVVGRYLELEIRMLDKIFNNMNKPVMAVIGGSKISTKIILLNNLLKKVDKLVIGGAMANTFLAAKNFSVGNSLIEKDKVYIAKDILLKAKQETRFYNSLSSVLGKGFQLAQYQIFAGDPGYINEDIKQIQNVTIEDVNRVYEQYVQNKNFVATSFVPKGDKDLALSDATDKTITFFVNLFGHDNPNFDSSRFRSRITALSG